MTLVRWSPRREMTSLSDPFGRFFDDPFFRPFWRDDRESMSVWNPAVDIVDKKDAVVIQAELPGIDKKDIAIDLKDRVLTIRGERTQEKEDSGENYCRRERVYGKFQRSFTLPTAADPEQVAAEFKDGVLTVSVPKSEAHKPRQITVH